MRRLALLLLLAFASPLLPRFSDCGTISLDAFDEKSEGLWTGPGEEDYKAGGEKIKVGINGFGTTSRLIAMILLDSQYNNNVELVAINNPSISIEHMAAVFNSESSRLQVRRHDFKVRNETTLLFGEKSITVLARRDPEEIPWAEMGVEYVVESTGSFTEMGKVAAHLKGGAKKVVITAVSNDAPMFVFGVNEKEYKPEYNIVSSGTYITSHLAPILKLIYDSFGILEGHITIVHSANATQCIDGPSRMDRVDRRPAFFNHIPIIITGAKAVGKIGKVLNDRFGIRGALVSTLNTFSAIVDAADAVGAFLKTINDSLVGIDGGPLNKLCKLLSIPAAKKTIDGQWTASSTETTTGEVQAVEKVLPYLCGKLNETVLNVPDMDGSIVDLTFRPEAEETVPEDIEAAIKELVVESEGRFKRISGYTGGDIWPSIFHATAVDALDKNHLKLIFDLYNQWGYACRVIDLIAYMAASTCSGQVSCGRSYCAACGVEFVAAVSATLWPLAHKVIEIEVGLGTGPIEIEVGLGTGPVSVATETKLMVFFG